MQLHRKHLFVKHDYRDLHVSRQKSRMMGDARARRTKLTFSRGVSIDTMTHHSAVLCMFDRLDYACTYYGSTDPFQTKLATPYVRIGGPGGVLNPVVFVFMRNN